jgi:hypothetical protein
MGGKSKKNGLGPKTQAALEACGLEWWEESGKKHVKLYVAGRLASVRSHGTGKRSREEEMDDNTAKSVRKLVAAILRGDA